MKYSCVILLLVFLSGSTVSRAQKDFEGYVEYHGSEPASRWDDEVKEKSPDDKSPEHIIRVYFSPGKIRAESTRKNKSKETVIVLLDSGLTYTIDDEMRRYLVKPLEAVLKLPPYNREVISGNWATPYVNEGDPVGLHDQRSVFWYADSLFFHIPEKYEGNEELVMLKNNRIMLKGFILSRGYSSGEREHPDTATILAVEVRQMINNPAIFKLPADYAREDRHSSIIIEDIKQEPDTVVPPPPPPPPKMPVQKLKTGKKDMRKPGDNQ